VTAAIALVPPTGQNTTAYKGAALKTHAAGPAADGVFGQRSLQKV
jgi:hypothetical protein